MLSLNEKIRGRDEQGSLKDSGAATIIADNGLYTIVAAANPKSITINFFEGKKNAIIKQDEKPNVNFFANFTLGVSQLMTIKDGKAAIINDKDKIKTEISEHVTIINNFLDKQKQE